MPSCPQLVGYADRVDQSCSDAVFAGAGVQIRHGDAIVSDQDGGSALAEVGLPGDVRLVSHSVGVAVVDASVVKVSVDHIEIAVAELGGLPVSPIAG